MASLELRSDRYRIVFRFAGKKFQTPLKTTEEKEALFLNGHRREAMLFLDRCAKDIGRILASDVDRTRLH